LKFSFIHKSSKTSKILVTSFQVLCSVWFVFPLIFYGIEFFNASHCVFLTICFSTHNPKVSTSQTSTISGKCQCTGTQEKNTRKKMGFGVGHVLCKITATSCMTPGKILHLMWALICLSVKRR
jgi:hypothetical protein